MPDALSDLRKEFDGTYRPDLARVMRLAEQLAPDYPSAADAAQTVLMALWKATRNNPRLASTARPQRFYKKSLGNALARVAERQDTRRTA